MRRGEDAGNATASELTQMVLPGLVGVHEPGLEQELSDDDLLGWKATNSLGQSRLPSV